nr:pyruvate kinase [Gemmatimonadota bacterium]
MTGIYIQRTKIVCTLGPASSTEEGIRGLMQAGMNVARLNFSHGTHAQHAETIATLRRLSRERSHPVALLGDLQGPRIRVGDIPGEIHVQQGDDLILVHEGLEEEGEIPITYDALASDVHEGDRILIDDGLIELIAIDVKHPRVTARVLHGGPINPHKGLNLPGVQVSAPSITEKDVADVQFAVEQDLDYLALSFVRRAKDIEQLRAMLPKGLLIIAKIEKDVALTNIESIIEASDGVMVARGDLGVELPFEEVPGAQKRIIALANLLGRPVITATQMLESMVENPRPTRAEASDVANAILDGADAVMLSGETSVGAYPFDTVRTMADIISNTEEHGLERIAPLGTRPRTKGGAITRAAAEIGDTLGVKYLCCFSQS